MMLIIIIMMIIIIIIIIIIVIIIIIKNVTKTMRHAVSIFFVEITISYANVYSVTTWMIS